MSAPILVTGGTGTLGRQVVPRLQATGHPVRVLSRHHGHDQPQPGVEVVTGDLATGHGIDAAVQDTQVVVHLAGSATGDHTKARHLAQAAAAAGVRHLVFISVVGADRLPVTSRLDRALFGYYAAKGAAEQAIANSGLGWTTLRATQFHDLALTTIQQLARLPVVPVPSGWQLQPVDPAEVADRLVELALGPPAGLVPDLGGPRIYPLAELVGSYLAAVGKRRPIVPLWLPGKANRAFRAGANLSPDRAVGRRTWEDFLAGRVSAPTPSRSGSA